MKFSKDYNPARFRKGGDPRRFQEMAAADERLVEAAPADFASFARDLLANASVRAALVRRLKRGDTNATELRMLLEAAQSAAPAETDRDRAREAAAAQVKRLTKPEQTLWHALNRKMRGESETVDVGGHEWRLVRRPGQRASAEQVDPYKLPPADPPAQPAPEPDLDPDRPLAAANTRMRALPEPPPRRPLLSRTGIEEVGPRSAAPTVEVIVGDDPRREANRLARVLSRYGDGVHPTPAPPGHDVGSAEHRATCRGCRRAFLR